MQVETLKRYKVNEAVIQTGVDALNMFKNDLVQFTLEQKEKKDPSCNQALIKEVKNNCITLKDRIARCRKENQAVLDVLDQMDEKHKQVLMLFYIKGLTRKEISQVMQYSVRYIPELKRIAQNEFERR